MLTKNLNYKTKRCEIHGTWRALPNEKCPACPAESKALPGPSENKADTQPDIDDTVAAAVLSDLDTSEPAQAATEAATIDAPDASNPAAFDAAHGLSVVPEAVETTDFPKPADDGDASKL